MALLRHPEAALQGAGVEMAFRVAVGGWWGSLVQALRNAQPAWLAGLVGAVALPITAQALEYAALKWGGVTHLKTAMVVSTIFSAGSVLANFLLMRRGLLLTGAGTESLGSDFRGLPRALRAAYLAAKGTCMKAPRLGSLEGGIR
jgi:hypothetical protein